MLFYAAFLALATLLPLSASSALHRPHHQRQIESAAIANGVDLRILCLGDSITWGERSSDKNGYRLELYNKLSATNEVDFVGQEESGTMDKNKHEGHPGFPIGPVGDKGFRSFSERPNVILLMAGTNDIVRNMHPENAPKALGNLIKNITTSCPDAVLLVATVPPLLDPQKAQMVMEFNGALPAVIQSFADKDVKVALVRMMSIGPQHIQPDDGIHPTDSGYKVIAQSWYDAIVDAGKVPGWLMPPLSVGSAHSPQNATDDATSTVHKEKVASATAEAPAETDESPDETEEQAPSATAGSLDETDEDHAEIDTSSGGAKESQSEKDEDSDEVDKSTDETESQAETDENPEEAGEADATPTETNESPDKTAESQIETDKNPDEAESSPAETNESQIGTDEKHDKVDKSPVEADERPIEADETSSATAATTTSLGSSSSSSSTSKADAVPTPNKDTHSMPKIKEPSVEHNAAPQIPRPDIYPPTHIHQSGPGLNLLYIGAGALFFVLAAYTIRKLAFSMSRRYSPLPRY